MENHPVFNLLKMNYIPMHTIWPINAGQGFDTRAMFASMLFIVVYLHIFRGQFAARD
jgi:hypothetical protein